MSSREASLIFIGQWDLLAYFQREENEILGKDTVKIKSRATLVVISLDHDTPVLPESFYSNISDIAVDEIIIDRERVNDLVFQYHVSVLPTLISSDEALKDADRRRRENEDSSSTAALAFRSALEKYNEFNLNDAVKLFTSVISKEATHKHALFNLASIFHMTGWVCLALAPAETLLLLDPSDSTVHSFLWAIAQSEHERVRERAREVYERLAGRGDVLASHKLAALTGEGRLARSGDPSYARLLYDDLATVFESKLVGSLEYKAPWIFREMIVDRLGPSRFSALGQVLDLGCGSGLIGSVFREGSPPVSTELFSSSSARIGGMAMVGVDVSPRIAALAAERRVYDAIIVDDLSVVLRDLEETLAGSFDLIVAADTFIYVGALNDTFMRVKRLLRAGEGLFAFSSEDLDTSPMKSSLYPSEESFVEDREEEKEEPAGAAPGWGVQLLQSARFGHSSRYIQVLADKHGFAIVSTRTVTLRLESTVPIQGILYLLQVMSKDGR